MTRILPYLLLPLLVALLQAHAIIFWTLSVTGAWPGWFTVGFFAAWPAWGWSIALEVGALWAWLQSRGANGVGWSMLGGLLTLVLCTGTLWNVAAPLTRNAELTEAISAEINRANQREETAQMLSLRAPGVPYRRLMDNLLVNQDQSTLLFKQKLELLKSGQAVSGLSGRFLLALQIIAVILGQFLVILSARAIGGENERVSRSVNFRRPRISSNSFLSRALVAARIGIRRTHRGQRRDGRIARDRMGVEIDKPITAQEAVSIPVSVETSAETQETLVKPLPIETVSELYRRVRAILPQAKTFEAVAVALTEASPDAQSITKKIIWQMERHERLLNENEQTLGIGQFERIRRAVEKLEASATQGEA